MYQQLPLNQKGRHESSFAFIMRKYQLIAWAALLLFSIAMAWMFAIAI